MPVQSNYHHFLRALRLKRQARFMDQYLSVPMEVKQWVDGDAQAANDFAIAAIALTYRTKRNKVIPITVC